MDALRVESTMVLALTGADRVSETWRKVDDFLTLRIAVLQRKLETPGVPFDASEGIRFTLKELRNLRKAGVSNQERGPTL